jgi:3-deoxy-D-arabino-heptulosonate 7-phosphate (DAHP) synthase
MLSSSTTSTSPTGTSGIPDPEQALSDGFQALTPATFRQMMAECRKVAEALGREM